MLLYLDTNVYVSCVFQEMGKGYRMMEEYGYQFFAWCKLNKISLVISDHFYREVKAVTSLDQKVVLSHLSELGLVMVPLFTTSDTRENAGRIERLYRLHYADALHVSLAKEGRCDYIITWNTRDFLKTHDIIPAATPKEFMEKFAPTHFSSPGTNAP